MCYTLVTYLHQVNKGNWPVDMDNNLLINICVLDII